MIRLHCRKNTSIPLAWEWRLEREIVWVRERKREREREMVWCEKERKNVTHVVVVVGKTWPITETLPQPKSVILKSHTLSESWKITPFWLSTLHSQTILKYGSHLVEVFIDISFSGPFTASFPLISTVFRNRLFNNSWWWLDSNPGSLVSEASPLSAEPRPLSIS